MIPSASVLVTSRCHLEERLAPMSSLNDQIWVECSKNASFDILVVVIPKEGFVGKARQFFLYDTDNKFVIYSLHQLCLVLYQKKDCPGPDRQSFSWVDNDRDLKRRIFASPDSFIPLDSHKSGLAKWCMLQFSLLYRLSLWSLRANHF